MKKPSAARQSAAVKKDDLVFRKILILFLVSFVAEIICLVLNRLYIYAGTFMTAHAVVAILQWVGIGVFALGIVLLVALWKKDKARYGGMTAIAGLITVLACQFMEFFYPHGARYLCYIIPIVLVVGLVYYIYQKEFLFSTVIGVLTLAALWVFRKGVGNANWSVAVWVIGIVLSVVFLLLGFWAWHLVRSGGQTKLFGKSLVIFPRKANYQPIWVSCAIGMISLFAALILGGTVAYFLLFLIAAYLLVLAVYYTTKLM